MKRTVSCVPEADAGGLKPLATETNTLPHFGDKSALAAMLGMSKRSVDNLMRLGCPYLALGSRRVRFDLREASDWVREKFRVQRFGPAQPNASKVKVAKGKLSSSLSS